MLLKVLYLLFIFIEFSGTFISVGGIALRYYVMFLLLIVLIVENKFYFDKIWGVYTLFIAFFGLSCLETGFWSLFPNLLFKQYFISFVGWVSTVAVLKKDASFIKYIILTILPIGFLDTLVTISQFTFNVSWYAPIEDFFQFTSKSVESLYDGVAGIDVMDGTVYGMFSNGVYNGNFLMICTILSSVFAFKYKKLWLYILPIFFLVGSFCCQQRGPLLISVLVLFFVIIKDISTSKFLYNLLFFALIVVLIDVVVSAMSYSDSMGLRYSTRGLEDANRLSIYTNTFDYIIQNPIFPNLYELVQQKGHAPHNVILNAYVYGGPFTFIIIMWILFYQARHVWRILKEKVDGIGIHYHFFALVWIAFTLNSLVHNMSIVTGEFLIWMIWGVLTNYCPPKKRRESFNKEKVFFIRL